MSAGESIDLASVPGLGPVRRAALESAGVTDLRGLLALTVEELSAVQGIGAWQARKIREFLRQQGLLVESHRETGPDGQVHEVAVVREPRNAAEADALRSAVEALETQAAVEAELQEEARVLAEAVAESELSVADGPGGEPEPAPRKGKGKRSRSDAKAAEGEKVAEPAPVEDSQEEAAPAVPPAAAGEEEAPAGAFEELSAQREQLPETALALIRAIREAAVAPQLTRQITRLLITASEFVSQGRPLSDETRRKALATLQRADQALQAEVEKRSFSGTAQRALAKRIRRRRKDLEALLVQE